jgi:hypothetical protein
MAAGPSNVAAKATATSSAAATPRASAVTVIRGTRRSSIAAMPMPVFNAGPGFPNLAELDPAAG